VPDFRIIAPPHHHLRRRRLGSLRLGVGIGSLHGGIGVSLQDGVGAYAGGVGAVRQKSGPRTVSVGKAVIVSSSTALPPRDTQLGPDDKGK
jgi:hypothetical protein